MRGTACHINSVLFLSASFGMLLMLGAGAIRMKYLVLLTVVNLFNYLDRYLVAALLPHLSTHFTLNHTQGGFLVSSFVFGYVIASPVAGYVASYCNLARFAFCGVIIFSLSTILCAFAPSYWWFVVARIGIGVGEGIFATIAPALISAKVTSPHELSKTLAVFFSAIPVGAALSFVLAGYLGVTLGWQSAFLIAGAGSLLAGTVLCSTYWLRAVPVATLDSSARGGGFLKGLYRQAWGNKLIRYAIIGYAFHTFCLQAIASFVSTYSVSVLKVDPDTASQIFGVILVVTGFLGTWIGGVAAQRCCLKFGKEGEFLVITCSAFICVVLVLLSFCLSREWFYPMAALTELTAFLTIAPINAILLNRVAPEFKTSIQGLTILVINFIGSFLGPVVIGAIADSVGIRVALQCNAVSMLLAAAFWCKSYKVAQVED